MGRISGLREYSIGSDVVHFYEQKSPTVPESRHMEMIAGSSLAGVYVH